ncbi:hypothetical protein F6U93_09790 [Tamlana haliotis]|uniref:DUF3829 domain-containing protein n=1 Tax=Pseudotamlana haliotis TaxID=2614804 RepID=A0A6N6MBI9_9FLAO|nr:hypothetical protein [Tamlana haliotis]KAB1067571.1 hypothetical protein F6U93_09790 [Tamlana haliotis]
MKITKFIIVIFLLFPLLSYTQTDDNPVLKSYLNNFNQKIKPQYEKNIKAVYKLDSLKFKIDKIEDYEIQLKLLQTQLKETEKLFQAIIKEPKPTGLDEYNVSQFIYDTSIKHIEEINKAIGPIDNNQKKFIALVEMTNKNNIIESKTDLFKIWDVYLSFKKLNKYHNDLSIEIHKYSNMLEYEKENNYSGLNCERLMSYLKFCDDFDTVAKNNYIKTKDSIVKLYYLLPAKYQSIKIIPTLKEEEVILSSDSREEKNRKIAIQSENTLNRMYNELFREFRGHYSDDLFDPSYANFHKSNHLGAYYTDFTEQLREKITKIKQDKNCN